MDTDSDLTAEAAEGRGGNSNSSLQFLISRKQPELQAQEIVAKVRGRAAR